MLFVAQTAPNPKGSHAGASTDVGTPPRLVDHALGARAGGGAAKVHAEEADSLGAVLARIVELVGARKAEQIE
jgi:hypothetical protein